MEAVWESYPDVNQYKIPEELKDFYERLPKEYRGEYDVEKPEQIGFNMPPVPRGVVKLPIPNGDWEHWIFACMSCGAICLPEKSGEEWSVRACPCGSKKYHIYYRAWKGAFEGNGLEGRVNGLVICREAPEAICKAALLTRLE